MESQEGDVSSRLLNKVTIQPSSLRSSEHLPTTILSEYNESLNLKNPRHLFNIDQLRHD